MISQCGRWTETARVRSGTLHRQAGLSLVELMVSLVIGLVIIAGTTQVFVSSSRTLDDRTQVERAQEALRFSVKTLAGEIRQAEQVTVSGGEIVVTYTSGSDDDRECFQNEVDAGDDLVQVFLVADGELRCRDSNGDEVPLAGGVTALDAVWFYFLDDDPPYQETDNVAAFDPDDIRGLRLRLGVQRLQDAPPREIEVTVALRQRILADTPFLVGQ